MDIHAAFLLLRPSFAGTMQRGALTPG